jgi:hypothetical protein
MCIQCASIYQDQIHRYVPVMEHAPQRMYVHVGQVIMDQNVSHGTALEYP